MTKAGTAAIGESSGLLLDPVDQLSPLDTEAARAELTEVASAAKEDGLARLAQYLSAKGKGQDFLGAGTATRRRSRARVRMMSSSF